ncbi:uncharacterized protein [Nicotiana tomentosiformis]|uniref:uncharacterized protein n=1 Tax=Nicotiana tomentosiformis TaxID=4098 RepID=UPI00388C6B04
MMKGHRNNDEATMEVQGLKDTMQQLMEGMAELRNSNKELKDMMDDNERQTQIPEQQGAAFHIDSTGSSKGNRTSFVSSYPYFSRLSKLEFPRFSGKDLRTWLYKVDQFFTIDDIHSDQRVKVASIHFEGGAIPWHQAYMGNRLFVHPPIWNEYVMALVERFGTEFDDLMADLKNLKQVGSVREYQASFDKTMTRLNLPQGYAFNCFLTGLKPEISYSVRLLNPQTLSHAYYVARIQEAAFIAQNKAHKVPLLPTPHPSSRKISEYLPPKASYSKPSTEFTPYSTQNPPSKPFQRKLIPTAEMNAKREKGLCYFCDEKYTPGHKCKGNRQLYMLEIEEGEAKEEENFEDTCPNDADENLSISLHALNRTVSFQTLRVT